MPLVGVFLKVNTNGSILQFGIKSHQLSLCGSALHLDMLERGHYFAIKCQNENVKPHDALKVWY